MYTFSLFFLPFFLLSCNATLPSSFPCLTNMQTQEKCCKFYFTWTLVEGDASTSDTSFSFLPALPWSSHVQSCLKYFLGGGLGFDDLGFLTRISDDFLVFCKGRPPSLQAGGEFLSELLAENEYSRPGCRVIGTSTLCTLAFKSVSWCTAAQGAWGLQLLSLLERIMRRCARRVQKPMLLSMCLSQGCLPCQLISSLLTPVSVRNMFKMSISTCKVLLVRCS